MILVSGRCSVATANGFEPHYFENVQSIESFTSLAFIFSKRGLIFHRMPYRFSAWISGKVWPFWFSSAQIVSGYLFETYLCGCFSKSWLQLWFHGSVPCLHCICNLFPLPAPEVFMVPYDFRFFFAVQSA